jgi:hypothetical protein
MVPLRKIFVAVKESTGRPTVNEEHVEVCGNRCGVQVDISVPKTSISQVVWELLHLRAYRLHVVQQFNLQTEWNSMASFIERLYQPATFIRSARFESQLESRLSSQVFVCPSRRMPGLGHSLLLSNTFQLINTIIRRCIFQILIASLNKGKVPVLN